MGVQCFYYTILYYTILYYTILLLCFVIYLGQHCPWLVHLADKLLSGDDTITAQLLAPQGNPFSISTSGDGDGRPSFVRAELYEVGVIIIQYCTPVLYSYILYCFLIDYLYILFFLLLYI